MSTQNALDCLTKHFAALGKREVKHELIPFSMFCEPLTIEDHLEAKAAQDSKTPKQQARALAGLLSRKLKLEDGTPAFRDRKGRTVERMVEACPPEVLWNLLEQVMDGATQAEVAELEKKSEPADEATQES